MRVLRRSKLGLTLAGAYLLLAAAIQAWLAYSARTNPADSGEGGVLLVLLAMPWPTLIPRAILDAPAADHFGPFLVWTMIALNAFLLYCIGGGLRWRTHRR